MPTPLTTLVAILSLIACHAASSQGDPKREFSFHRVAGNVYMLDGVAGGNVAALVGSDGLVLVDTQLEPFQQRVLAALKTAL